MSRFWRIGLAVCWAAASMVGGWAAVFGSRSFESPATLVSLGALLLCTLCLLKTTPNPIGWDSGLAPGPAGDTPGAETRPAEGSPSTFTTAGRKTSPWFLPLVLLAFLLLSILRTLAGPGLLFGLPVVGVIGLILIRQPLPRRESLYAGVLGTVACLAGLASRQISGIPPAAWAALQMALVSIGLLAGWAILKRFGLQDQGVGQVRLLRDGWPSALRGFGSGALLALPWALANVDAGSSQGDSWVRAWWQPLTALQPGIAEEAWGRVLIVPFLFVLLRPFTRTRTAFGAALILAAYWFAYLHTPGGLGGIPSTLILGTLYALPLSALCLYRDLETAIGFHFLIDFIRFSAAFALYGIAGG